MILEEETIKPVGGIKVGVLTDRRAIFFSSSGELEVVKCDFYEPQRTHGEWKGLE